VNTEEKGGKYEIIKEFKAISALVVAIFPHIHRYYPQKILHTPRILASDSSSNQSF
jgi:hypothetical protein